MNIVGFFLCYGGPASDLDVWSGCLPTRPRSHNVYTTPLVGWATAVAIQLTGATNEYFYIKKFSKWLFCVLQGSRVFVIQYGGLASLLRL